jgi:hypothetical protein
MSLTALERDALYHLIIYREGSNTADAEGDSLTLIVAAMPLTTARQRYGYDAIDIFEESVGK